MARPERWVTAERLVWLQKEYPLHCVAETCRLFNERFGTDIHPNQMRAANRYRRFGRAKRTGEHNKYTKEMIQWLRKRYLKHPLKKTAKNFERRFGIAITTMMLRNIAVRNDIERRPQHAPNSGQFKKGNQTGKRWEKGECGKGCEKGWFKKGHIPLNKRPMFSERWGGKNRPEQQMKIPLPCPHTGRPFRWSSKARYVWEQEHGAIPAGHVIIHLDGNSANCAIENLVCVPRKALVFLNSKYAQKTDHEELKPILVRIAQMKSAIHDRTRTTLKQEN